MKFVPHEYQAHTTQYILEHPQAAVLLGMGLGKTIITLTAINELFFDYYAVQKALIIAPLRVARDTWPAELAKWEHLQDLMMSVIVGTKKEREQALAKDAHVYVINRENIPWLVTHLGKSWPFDMVVIDELSSFKNHNSKRFKALKAVRPKITRIVGLTGTPAPNSLLDLWAQFRILDQGQRLGKFIGPYRGRYFQPDKRNGHQIFSWKLRPGADQQIYDAIADMTISMRTTDYLQLPPLTISDRVVRMGSSDLAKYQKFKRDMVMQLESGEDIDAVTAAALAGKLQQLSSGAVYTENGYEVIHDQKLDALEDIIESANGESVLVAVWFKHEIPRIMKRFPNAIALDTAEDFKRWNTGKISIGLIHPASAGHGLNLQAGGHIMVWLSLPWSLELYEQANARLFRQGQTEPVSIVRILCDHTIDTDIVAALDGKHATQEALIKAVSAQLEEA